MKESFQENTSETPKFFRTLSDYYNELQEFSAVKDPKLADEKWIDGLNNKRIKSGEYHLKTLDERYARDIESSTSTEEFYIEHSGLDTPERKQIFFEKREKLNELVEKFNEELRKENPDTSTLKSIYEEMDQLIN